MTFNRSLKHHKYTLLLRRRHMDQSLKPKYHVGQLKMYAPWWDPLSKENVVEIIDVDDDGTNSAIEYTVTWCENGGAYTQTRVPENQLSRVPFTRFLRWRDRKGAPMIGFSVARAQLYGLVSCAIIATLTQVGGGALVSQGWLNAISLFFGAGIPLIILAAHYYNWQRRCL